MKKILKIIRNGIIARIHANGAAYFIHSDELGNVIAVSDASGNLVKQTCYGPYGDIWAQSGNFDTPWGFGGAYGVYTDPDTELGSTLALTDSAGAVTDQYTYSPYGEVLSHTGTNNTPYRWTGAFAVRDEGNGLYYMLNRTYSAEQQRFISPDPAGIDGGVNLYAYANLNPLAYHDPFGLCAETFKPVASGWDNFKSSLSSGWKELTQSQPQNTYAQSSFKYAAPSGPSYQMYDDARLKMDMGRPGAAAWSALWETVGRVGYDQLNSASSGYDTYTGVRLNMGQRLSAGVSGGLSVGMWAAGSVGTIGRGASAMAGALTRSEISASRAAVSSRLPAPSSITRTPNEAGVVREFVTKSEQVFYRVYSGDKTQGAFLTAIPPKNRAWAQEALALPRNNTAEYVQEVVVPAGTTLRRSRAAPISANEIFPNRRGGAEQFEIINTRLSSDNFRSGRILE